MKRVQDLSYKTKVNTKKQYSKEAQNRACGTPWTDGMSYVIMKSIKVIVMTRIHDLSYKTKVTTKKQYSKLRGPK
jgi:hypothetical protein